MLWGSWKKCKLHCPEDFHVVIVASSKLGAAKPKKFVQMFKVSSFKQETKLG